MAKKAGSSQTKAKRSSSQSATEVAVLQVILAPDLPRSAPRRVNKHFGRADSTTLAAMRAGLEESGARCPGRTRLPRSYAITWIVDEIIRTEEGGDYTEENGIRYLEIAVPTAPVGDGYVRRHCEITLSRKQANTLARIVQAMNLTGTRLAINGEATATMRPRFPADAIRFLTSQAPILVPGA